MNKVMSGMAEPPLGGFYTTSELCEMYRLSYSSTSQLLAKFASIADSKSLRFSSARNASRKWTVDGFWACIQEIKERLKKK